MKNKDIKNMEDIAKIFNALSNPKKIKGFLYLLEGRELTEISRIINAPRSSFQRYIEGYYEGRLIRGEGRGGYELTKRGEKMLEMIGSVDSFLTEIQEEEGMEKFLSIAREAKEAGVFESPLSKKKLEELLKTLEKEEK